MEKCLKGIPILFENEICLVLNKPSGLPVQGGEKVQSSLDSILSVNFSPRPLLVHRLDKDCSGLILVAKTREAAHFFSAIFSGGTARKDRAIVRQYLGLCSGLPKGESGVIRLDLDVRGRGQARARRKSETFYKTILSGSISASTFSLLELELGTGRMHQIRRHLSQEGHPLLGDDKYGDFPLNRQLRKVNGLKHLLLHASRLVIQPSPGLPLGIDVTAPLPEYFSLFLQALNKCSP